VRAVDFFREVKQELVKVKWPAMNEVGITLAFVIVAAGIAGIVLLLVDSAIYKLVKMFLGIGGAL